MILTIAYNLKLVTSQGLIIHWTAKRRNYDKYTLINLKPIYRKYPRIEIKFLNILCNTIIYSH